MAHRAEPWLKYGPLTEEQFQKIEAKLLEDMKQVRTIYGHYDQMAQLVASGEIWLADADDGGARQAKAKGLPIEIAYPAEGLTAWYDGPCVVAQAPHPEAAYAFINHMMSPEIQARLPKELGYAPANGKAHGHDRCRHQKAMDLDTLVTNIPKIQFQYNLGADFDNRAIQIWEKAKATVAK